MAFCSNCGTNMADGAKFCASCGKSSAPPVPPANPQAGFYPPAPSTLPPQQYQQPYTQQQPYVQQPGQPYQQSADVAANKVFAILAYLGILVLIPIFAAKESRFARYHANQGLVLLIAEIALAIAISILSFVLTLISWRLYFIGTILQTVLWLGGLAFVIIGIINASGGKEKPLPVIGTIQILK